jgi:hypothetical protein
MVIMAPALRQFLDQDWEWPEWRIDAVTGFHEGHETAWIAIASWNGLPARINAAGRNKAPVFALPAEWTIHLSGRLPWDHDHSPARHRHDLNAQVPAPIAHWRAIWLRWARAECPLCNS